MLPSGGQQSSKLAMLMGLAVMKTDFFLIGGKAGGFAITPVCDLNELGEAGSIRAHEPINNHLLRHLKCDHW
jgi:hypothetical protein